MEAVLVQAGTIPGVKEEDADALLRRGLSFMALIRLIQASDQIERFLNKTCSLFVDRFEKLQVAKIELVISRIESEVEKVDREHAPIAQELAGLKERLDQTVKRDKQKKDTWYFRRDAERA